MAFVAVAVGGMAGAGLIGGALKSGPDANMYGRGEAQKAYDAYRNLVGAGPGQQDVTNSLNASRDYSTVLSGLANTGFYNSSEGNRLAEMQFAPQRQALAQSLQDQMAMANRAASAAGRSTNDPILRARLGAEQMRQAASLNAQQSAASMDLGRQSTLDMLNVRGQNVNMLQGLASQAFNNQNNLFGMGAQIQQMDTSNAQYEASRGGGLKGAITGGITGAGAGMQMISGFGNISNATRLTNAGIGVMDRMGQPSSSANFSMPQMGSQFNQAPASAGMGWSGGMSAAPQFPSLPALNRSPSQWTTSSDYTVPTNPTMYNQNSYSVGGRW